MTPPKQPPRFEREAISWASEIKGIVGRDTTAGTIDVFWTDCDPYHATTIQEWILHEHAPTDLRPALLQNSPFHPEYSLEVDQIWFERGGSVRDMTQVQECLEQLQLDIVTENWINPIVPESEYSWPEHDLGIR